EAVELRDGDPARHAGLGVRTAVGNVRDIIAKALVGRSVLDQAGIDRLLCELDGTPNKSRLGANAVLGVSLACAHAAAAVRGLPLWRYLASDGEPRLPLPMVNLVSGGLHAGGNLDFQDFLLLPVGARTYSEALEMAVAVYRALATLLDRRGLEGMLVGDEGGFGPRLQSNEEAVQLALEAVRRAGLEPGRDAALAVDVASTHFFREGHYHFKAIREAALSPAGMIDLLRGWAEKYPLLSIEDGMAEDDWDG